MATTLKNKADAIAENATAEAEALALAQAAQIVRDQNIALATIDIEALGEAFAKGAVALTDAAIYFGTKVASGDIGETDAEVLYLAFANASNRARSRGAAFLPADAKSAKSQISTFRTFGRPTVARIGLEVADFYDRVSTVYDAMDRKLTNSAYQSFAAINRAVDTLLLTPSADGTLDADANVSAFVAMLDADDGKVGREWITARITKKPAPTKDKLAQVAKIVEGLFALCEGDNAEATFAAGIGDEVKSLHTAMAALVASETAKGEKAKNADQLFRKVDGSNVLRMLANAA